MTMVPASTDSQAMMKLIAPVLMVASLGCASDVDLPLDLQSEDPTPASPSEPPPDQQSPPLGQPAWSRADFTQQGYVDLVAWATDGGLLATLDLLILGQDDRERMLARYTADGALEWEVAATTSDYVSALSATSHGGAVIGLSTENPFGEPARPAGLDWYDAGGNLAASWRADELGTEDMLRRIATVQALPDEGVFWAGATLSDDFERRTTVAGRLDADQKVQWVVPIPEPEGGEAYGFDVVLAADGDLLMLVSYQVLPYESSSFVVRLGQDGAEVWRALIDDASGEGIAVAPSGNLVVTGHFESSVTMGDLRVEDRSDGHHHFVAEIDPAGQPVGLHQLALPASIDNDEIGAVSNATTMIGDELIMAGHYLTFSSESPQLAGYYATAHGLDGGLRSELFFPTELAQQPGAASGPVAADASADGRLALGGAYSGRVDFGDGEVNSGRDGYGFDLFRPFIVVVDPLPPDHVD